MRNFTILLYFLSDFPGQCNPKSEWQCSDQRGCINRGRLCDLEIDCADLSDEDEDLCANVDRWSLRQQDGKRTNNV